jgi:Ribosomal silencing factor during starvation
LNLTQLKARKLKGVPGTHGAEGEKDDDWVVVDCGNMAVHLMLPETRKAVDLESHWGASPEGRPTIAYSPKESVYEENFEKLLEKHPIPEGYNVKEDDLASTIHLTHEDLHHHKKGAERDYDLHKKGDLHNKRTPSHIRRL